MPRWLFLPFVLLLAPGAWAQQASTVAPLRNAVYLELGGKSPYYSLNYERLLGRHPRLHWALSAGLGLTADELSVPLGIAALTGEGRHHAELSLGLTPAVRHYRRADTDKVLYAVSGVGYRYQRPGIPWFFGVGLTPVVFIDPPSYDPWDFSTRLYPSGRVLLGWLW